MKNNKFFLFCDNRIWDLGFKDGLQVEQGKLISSQDTGFYASVALDSTEEDTEWDAVCISSVLQAECYIKFQAYASNSRFVEHNNQKLSLDDIITGDLLAKEEKKLFLSDKMQVSFVNPEKAPLYQLKGRYLWFILDVIPAQKKEICIDRLQIFYQPESFMKLLPNVYTEYDKDGFMKRFVSIFQDIFDEFDDEIVNLHKKYDMDYLEAEGLRGLAGSRRFDVSEAWSVDKLRELLHEMNHIYCMKGTGWALSRVIRIFTGCEPRIIENETSSNSLRIILPYECINTKMQYDELLYLIDKFKPAFAKATLVLLKPDAIMDSNSYLEQNTVLMENDGIILEDGLELTDDLFHNKLTL